MRKIGCRVARKLGIANLPLRVAETVRRGATAGGPLAAAAAAATAAAIRRCGPSAAVKWGTTLAARRRCLEAPASGRGPVTCWSGPTAQTDTWHSHMPLCFRAEHADQKEIDERLWVFFCIPPDIWRLSCPRYVWFRSGSVMQGVEIGSMRLGQVRIRWVHSKNRTPVLGMLYCLGCKTKTGVVRTLVIFQDRPMFSHIIKKVSARAFHWYGWT